MKVYQSCGKITSLGEIKTVEIKTMLPEIPEGKYKYVKYYNISNKDYFGLLGILLIEGGENKDLNDFNAPLNKIKVDEEPLKLNELLPINEGKDFSKIKQGDTIHFMCFHDEKFNGSDKELKVFQESLPKFPDFDFIEEPKVGNGGVLTFEGCM